MTAQNTLNLSASPRLFPVTYTNGPGLRYVIWTQGCSLRCCNNCLNPELLEPSDGVTTGIPQLIHHLKKLKQQFSIQGITILGGEPTDQAPALAQLAPQIKKLNLSIMLYTGLSLDKLNTNVKQDSSGISARLLSHVDILVEGDYRPHLDFPGTLWRGSVNQRIILLSQHYSVPRIKELLNQTNRTIEKIDLIPDYFGNRLFRKHWLQSLPIAQTSAGKDQLHQPQEVSEIRFLDRLALSWLPELAHQLPPTQQILSPKGLAGVIDVENRLHLFGFQQKEIIRQFKKNLNSQGIHLENEPL